MIFGWDSQESNKIAGWDKPAVREDFFFVCKMLAEHICTGLKEIDLIITEKWENQHFITTSHAT